MAITPQKINTIITKYGIAGTCKTYATSTYDYATGEVTNGAETDNKIKMLAPYAPFSDGDKEFMIFVKSNADFKKAEAVTLFASYGLTFAPTLKMELTETRNSKTWRIMGFMPLEYKGTIVAYAAALQKLEGAKDSV